MSNNEAPQCWSQFFCEIHQTQTFVIGEGRAFCVVCMDEDNTRNAKRIAELEDAFNNTQKAVNHWRQCAEELEAERDALKAERNSAVKLCREHNLCLCNFSQKLAGDGCFICR